MEPLIVINGDAATTRPSVRAERYASMEPLIVINGDLLIEVALAKHPRLQWSR